MKKKNYTPIKPIKSSTQYICFSILMLTAPCLFAQDCGTLQIVKVVPLGQTQPAPEGVLAVDVKAAYSNVTTFSGSGLPTGVGAGTVSSNAISKMIGDDLTFVGTAPFSVTQFRFNVANFNAVTVSARPLIRFYAADGTSGGPGTYIKGFDFNPISLTSGSISTFVTPTLTPFSVTTNKVWACILFDNNTGATVATAAQLENLGMGIFTTPDLGTSADAVFKTTTFPASGSFSASSPTGSIFNFTNGSPVANLGWEINTDCTLLSAIKASTNPTTAGSTVAWTVTFNRPMGSVTASNFSLVSSGGLSGSLFTTVTAVGGSSNTQWRVTATVGTGSGTLGLNFVNSTGMATSITNTLPFTGEVYTVSNCINDITPPVFKNSNFYVLDKPGNVQILFLANSDSVALTSTPYPSAIDNCDVNPIIRLVSGATENQGFGGFIRDYSILRFEAIDHSSNRSEILVHYGLLRKTCVGNQICIKFPASSNVGDYIVVSSSGAQAAQQELLEQRDTVESGGSTLCFSNQQSFKIKIYLPTHEFLDRHPKFTDKYIPISLVPLDSLVAFEPIDITPCTPIPVELVRFYAQSKGKENHLYWATASEFQSHKFEIERSSDGKSFFKMGEIPSAGKAANYEFIDAHPLSISYYRLRQIDFNGKETLSNIISIVRGVTDEITLFPNPTNGKLFIKSSEFLSKSVRIVNNLGQIVLVKAIIGNEIDMSDLPKGMYYIEISSETQRIQKRIFKN